MTTPISNKINIESRRAFMKRLGKLVAAVVPFMVMETKKVVAAPSEDEPVTGCNSGCRSGCRSGCKNACFGCDALCRRNCMDSCRGTCLLGCRGTCEGYSY